MVRKTIKCQSKSCWKTIESATEIDPTIRCFYCSKKGYLLEIVFKMHQKLLTTFQQPLETYIEQEGKSDLLEDPDRFEHFLLLSGTLKIFLTILYSVKLKKKNNTEIRFSKYSIVNSICAFFSLIGNPLSLIDKLCSQIRNSFSRIKISSVDLNNLFSWIWIDTKVLVLQKFEWDVTNSKFGSHGD